MYANKILKVFICSEKIKYLELVSSADFKINYLSALPNDLQGNFNY